MAPFQPETPTKPSEPSQAIHQQSSSVEEQRLQSFNPADRSVVGAVEVTPAADSEGIVARAGDAQRAFWRTPLAERVQMGRRLHAEVLKWRRELMALVVDETGKSPLEARWELWKTCDEATDLLARATQTLRRERARQWWRPHRVVASTWQPRGVVLVVAAAYEPLQTTLAPALAALVAGNAVIVVGDERAPLTVKSLTNIAADLLEQPSLCTGWVGGRRLIDSLADRVDGVISYGPPMMTRRLARRQGDRTIPVLGRWPTSNALLVLNDADLARAARAALFGACGGAGRTRRAIRRIYVQDAVADLFVDALVQQMGNLRQGQDSDPRKRRVGPLFEPRDLERLQDLVEDACRRGARLIAGGRQRPRCRGTYFEPTILTGVDESMRLWREPAPGPVVAISTVQAPADAARRIRDLPGYGAVTIFSANRKVARNLAQRLDAPLVGINEVIDDLRPSSPSIQGTFDGPVDPTGADRLTALSRRVVTVERPLMGLPKILETGAPAHTERALDAAFAMLRLASHRPGRRR